MTEKLQYFRPRSSEEALALKQHFGDKAQFLLGGDFKPTLKEDLEALIDLQDTTFNDLKSTDTAVRIGGVTSLRFLDEALELPEFSKALSTEYGLNVRNTLSISNFLKQANGRSPVLVCLLAMNPTLSTFASIDKLPLHTYLKQHDPDDQVAELFITKPIDLAFESVGRSPKDLPIVCVAAKTTEGTLDLAFGGSEKFRIISLESNQTDALELASQIYSGATDQWASEEYRIAVGKVLLRRVLQKLAGHLNHRRRYEPNPSD